MEVYTRRWGMNIERLTEWGNNIKGNRFVPQLNPELRADLIIVNNPK